MSNVYICGDGFLGKELFNDFDCDTRYRVSRQMPELKRPQLMNHSSSQSASRELRDQRNSIFINASGPSNVQESFENYHESVELPAKQIEKHFELLDLTSVPLTYVYISSAAVYGETSNQGVSEKGLLKPMSPYAEGKIKAEETLIRLANQINPLVSVITLRVFSAYSENLAARILHKIAVSSRQNKHFVLSGSGNESRDYVHSRDVSRAIKFLVGKGSQEGQVFNVGTGEGMQLRKLMLIADKVYLDIHKRHLDYSFDGRKRNGDPIDLVANIDKISTLGFKPEVIPNQGLEKFFWKAFKT